eukprot:5999203-Pyramimonas_sp.AAC.1
MDLETMLKRHQPAAEAVAPSGGGAGAASGGASAHQEAPDKKKQKLAEMAEAADEALLWAEGALKQKDMQQALMVLLKLSCQHAQRLRDLAASEWLSVLTPTIAEV